MKANSVNMIAVSHANMKSAMDFHFKTKVGNKIESK